MFVYLCYVPDPWRLRPRLRPHALAPGLQLGRPRLVVPRCPRPRPRDTCGISSRVPRCWPRPRHGGLGQGADVPQLVLQLLLGVLEFKLTFEWEHGNRKQQGSFFFMLQRGVF